MAEAPPAATSETTDRYDGRTAAALAERLGLARVVLRARVGSTMDLAHALGAAGAPAGALVLADEQTSGRGRGGTVWESPPARGLWFSLLERPTDATALEVLSLRVGLAAAAALDGYADAPVRVKWPNDLFVAGRKLAGVLVEARWRDARPDWVAIGVGVNVLPPPTVTRATGLRPGTSRLEVLESLIPAIRGAASRDGPLDQSEIAHFARRDLARNRRCVLPARGLVAGITARGELDVQTADGTRRYFRAGSLELEEDA